MAQRPRKQEIVDNDPRETDAHPRRQHRLVGHAAAEQTFLDAWCGNRLHHAWMITGPKGIGKATFAFRVAKFVLANPRPEQGRPADLSTSPEDAAVHLVLARSHPDLFVLERAFDPKAERLKKEIAVEDVRHVTEFFSKTSAFGGWRIVIVDAVDDLNTSSANALLKILEEPPQRALFLLVCHSPGQVLKTIRSRCRMLPLRLPATDEGAFGLERDLQGTEAAGAMASIVRTATDSRALSFEAAARIAERVGGFGRDREFELFSFALVNWLRSEARRMALANHPAAFRWAKTASDVAETLKVGGDLNIDKRLTVLTALTSLMDTQQKT